MVEREKKRNNRPAYGILTFIVIVAIGIGASMLFSMLNGEDSNIPPDRYYGFPLDNAEYEIIFQSAYSNENGEIPIQVDPSWDGISIEAIYSSPCEGAVEIISPSGITTTTFEFSLTEDEPPEGAENTSSGQYITLQPGAWPGEIYGEWRFRYTLDGGPSEIIIKRVISFGTIH